MSEVVVATVESIVGTVIARDEDGNTRVLQPGDPIFHGEEVIAEDGAFIEMAFEDGSTMTLAGNESATITADLAESAEPESQDAEVADATVEEIIAALDRGEDITDLIEAPAAGLDGGVAGEGGSFVRVTRGSEEVGQVTYAYDSNSLRGPGEAGGEDGGTLADTGIGTTTDDTGTTTDEVVPEPSLVISVTPLSEMVSRVVADIRPQSPDVMSARVEEADVSPSEQPGTGLAVFSLDSTLDLDGLPDTAAGPIGYAIVGGDSDYLAIGTDSEGNPAVVLTEQGAWALQNGQVPNNEFSVEVQGTVEIEGIGPVSATEVSAVAVEVPQPTFDVELWPGEVFYMPPADQLPEGQEPDLQQLSVGADNVAGDFGFPASAVEAGMPVFWINPQADFDGIDPSLGDFSYEIVGGDSEYLELSQNDWGQWSVVLSEEGARAIQNGQVSGNDLDVTIEGSLTIGEGLVNTFMLEASAEGGVVVPTPQPELTVGMSAVDTPEDWPQSAAENDVVFEVTTDLDLDGIDGDLAGEIALSLNEDSGGYLALEGSNVVLTADGAAAIRNGQVGLDGLMASVEGTVTIAEDGVNPFVLTDDAQAGIEVPMPEPSLDVTVTAALELESSDQAAEGQLAFTLSSATEYAGIDPDLGGEVSYEITDGNDEGYFALNEAGDAIVLTDDGAQAIRNGQFDPAGASVTVTGTQDVDSFALTGVDVAGLEEVPTPEPTLTVGLELVDGATDGWPQSAAENDVVFEVTTDLDLDGIDGDLAGEIALSLNDDSSGYLALEGNNVVLTADGAAAIRNGQVGLDGLMASVEGTVTIAEHGVNPFVLTDDAQAGIEVPMPEPSLDVTVTAALELESSDQAAEGQLAFTLSSATEYAGIDPDLGGEVSYEITDGNDEGYFALNEAGDAIVLTDDGAQAIRNGQFDPAGASVTVTGTQDVDSFTLTDEDVAGLEEVPTPEPTLTVGLELVDGTTDGWPQSAAENDVVFEVTTDLDLDGIDGDLAGEIALSLNEDSGGYLALDGNNVVLTDAGAEAIRNGQVSGNELAAEVEGTVTIADGGVNPFVLTDDAQAAIEVPVPDSDPVPGPEITGLGDTDVTVDEANLANGTNPDEDALTQNGQFTITASAGVASLTFAGSDFNQTFNIDQLNDASEANPLSVDTSKGTLEITGFTGNDDGIYTVTYSYTLTDAADHPEQGRDELQKDAINVTVTDTNGGTANDAVNVTIVDDVPVVEDSTTGVLSTEAGTTLTGDSGLRIGADVDGASITSFTINEAYIDHDDGKDYILVDSGTPGETTNLTSGGEKVWFESSDGTLTGFIGEDTVVFTALLDVETGLYTVSLQKDLDAINAEDLGFFAPQNGGNTGEVIESAGSDLAIRFTATDSGGDPTSVNFSANSFGVGSGPRIGSGETLKAEFVQAGTTDVRETLQSLELETWGEQGPGANVAWSVFLDGELVGDGTGTTVSGVGAFDEIHISHGPGSGNFGIGGFGSLVGEGSGFSIPFEFEAMDGDGDPLGSDGGSDSGAFDLTFSPNNVFEGSSDSDVIIGTDDDDILIGGGGDDILTGGAGDDIFRWNAGDEGTSDAPANDVVTDFGNGDNVLDLKDLLQGESEENIADYIIAEQDGADTKLYVNSQGGLNGDTDNANQVITLKDVQYSDDIVKDMLDSGQLTIDQ